MPRRHSAKITSVCTGQWVRDSILASSLSAAALRWRLGEAGRSCVGQNW